jgi:hypothetical protein
MYIGILADSIGVVKGFVPVWKGFSITLPLWKRGIKGDLKSLSISLYEREKFIVITLIKGRGSTYLKVI